MKILLNRFYSLIIVVLFSISILPANVIALDKDIIMRQQKNSNKINLEMEIYDYTPSTSSNNDNDTGTIGDKLVDKQLLLPGNSYMMKLKLSSEDQELLRYGVSSISTYLEYDASKLDFDFGLPNSSKENLMRNQKARNIFDSGLGKQKESIMSWAKGYYDIIVNISDSGNGNKILSLLQSAKNGEYGDSSKNFKSENGDNFIACLVFTVKQNALSADRFLSDDENYIKIKSNLNEIDIFWGNNTNSRTIYNDSYKDDFLNSNSNTSTGTNKKYAKYSDIVTVKGIGRKIGEPEIFTLNKRIEVDGSTALDNDLYIYYTKDFRDTGYILTSTESGNFDYSKYYNISRFSNMPNDVTGSNDIINLNKYDSNEKITGLSNHPNTIGTITYTFDYKGQGKSQKTTIRNLNVIYLIGDIDNDGDIDDDDDILFTRYIKRKVNISSMLGKHEDESKYKMRALDINQDTFITVSDQNDLRQDISKHKLIKQRYKFLVD